MKKVIYLLFICFISLLMIVPCYGAEFENPPIIDMAGYLNEIQLEQLSEKLENVRREHNFDVAIVTEHEMSGYDAMNAADNIFDYLSYGAGENDDGILFYICSGTRDYWITTHADGLRIFNENGIEYLKKNIEPYLAEENYYLAMETYINLADELLKMADDGEAFNKKQYDSTDIPVVIGLALFLPLIIAYIMMKSKLAKMKTAVENDYAANYIKPGSKNLEVSRDIFLYSHVTKTAKPKNTSSGSHRSSSGRIHGGGGGRF